MFGRQRIRQFVTAGLICALAAEPLAAYQFGGLLGRRSSSSTTSENHCDTGSSAGRSVLSGVLGSAASAIGIPTFVPMAEFADVLSTEIACRLDEDEQEKAAEATIEATRGGEVGTTSEWESETRPGVRGRSTVTGRSQQANGNDCLQVTNVVIVDGEETTVPETMCRGPGQSRYVRQA